MELSPILLRELLHYDPKTGSLTWRKSGKGRRADKIAGYVHRTGYRVVRINGKMLSAHRIAWAIHHGAYPRQELDHIDRDRNNNRLGNLREVGRQENMRNIGSRKNATGATGVYLRKNGKYQAMIGINGKNVSLGDYSSLAEAKAARKAAEKEHNFHPAHGEI